MSSHKQLGFNKAIGTPDGPGPAGLVAARYF